MIDNSYALLSINVEVKVSETSKKNKIAAHEIMTQFKCGKTQTHEVLKNKNKITDYWSKEMVKWSL